MVIHIKIHHRKHSEVVQLIDEYIILFSYYSLINQQELLFFYSHIFQNIRLSNIKLFNVVQKYRDTFLNCLMKKIILQW